MNKKILAIIANHSNSNTKNIISLHNLSIIEKYVKDICIIDSQYEDYAMKLRKSLDNKKNIINYYFIPNDTYYDFGKWIYALNNIDKKILESYDYILFLNDSIIITPDIDKYFNYVEYFLDNKINLFAYNDSSQIKYHYQSYFFIIKPQIVHKLIHLFEEKKPLINNLLTLIENMELCLLDLDENHDCFIKIGHEFNKNINIYWHNDAVYSYLLSINYFAILKYKRIYDIYREYNYLSTKKETLDYDFFKEYYNLSSLTNEDLLKYYLEEGFQLGMKDNRNFLCLLPHFYREKLEQLNILYFFDIPSDFDIYYYKEYNPDLKDLPIMDTIVHYINYGMYENRYYNKEKKNNAQYINNFYKSLNIKCTYLLPYDFNPLFYKNNYNDLKLLPEENIISHYLNYGIYENRIYKLPNDFTPNNYKKCNNDLSSFNEKELIDHYINHGCIEGRKYNNSNDSLFSGVIKKENSNDYEYKATDNIYLPKDFYPLTYKKINYDLNNLSNEELEKHYIMNGFRENRYYKLPTDYTNNGYRTYNTDINKLNDIDLSVHFLQNGLKERRIYKIPDDFHCTIYKCFNRDLDKFNDTEIINHYITTGIYEKRYFRLNLYFNSNKYKELNPDLKHLNHIELIIHYIKNGIKERRKFQ